jgi:hypothetical protein
MVAVSVPNPKNTPQVIIRRRIELSDPRVAGSMQPFHAAKTMELQDAEAFIQSLAKESNAMATTAVREAVATLAAMGYRVTGACVLAGTGRVAANLAATLASHPMIHTAEGDFFRNALRHACESCALEVVALREKDLIKHSAATLDIAESDLRSIVFQIGKSIGPPWRQDEKMCTIAAWSSSLFSIRI